MDAFTVCHLHRLQKALRQGRVRMNGMHDIVRGNLLLPNHHRFGNHFRHVFAHRFPMAVALPDAVNGIFPTLSS